MLKVMFQKAIIEGFKNLVRSFWLSATAVAVLTVSLASFALASSLSTIAGFTLRQLDNQISITVYFKDDVDSSVIQKFQDDVKSRPEVKQQVFTNKEEAKKKLSESNRVSGSLVETLEASNVSLVLEYLTITPKNSDNYNSLENFVKDEKYSSIIDEVRGSRSIISNLQTIYYWTNLIGAITVIIFGLVSILVMVNILRIAIYNHRSEIEVMRLVGATNNYIRGPFIAEGAMFNIIAATIVLILFIPSLNIIVPYLTSVFNVDISLSSDLLLQVYLSLALTISLGVVVGVVTSYLATQKYLQQ
jgi:cell division transport system permease protein